MMKYPPNLFPWATLPMPSTTHATISAATIATNTSRLDRVCKEALGPLCARAHQQAEEDGNGEQDSSCWQFTLQGNSHTPQLAGQRLFVAAV
jgi:hypothetical protein